MQVIIQALQVSLSFTVSVRGIKPACSSRYWFRRSSQPVLHGIGSGVQASLFFTLLVRGFKPACSSRYLSVDHSQAVPNVFGPLMKICQSVLRSFGPYCVSKSVCSSLLWSVSPGPNALLGSWSVGHISFRPLVLICLSPYPLHPFIVRPFAYLSGLCLSVYPSITVLLYCNICRAGNLLIAHLLIANFAQIK